MSKRVLIPFALALCVLPASADQVTFDDTIISGSLCIGLDCVNGESFGFSTAVLKENNLRIYFQDTSSSASFPSTDWQLVANDSSNGGRNRFSIEDVTSGTEPFTVAGGAPTGGLYLSATGAVGMGTQSPAAALHVSSGDTPTTRLEQSGDQGWTPQVWDIGGNEDGLFLRDATAATTPVSIESGAVDQALVIHADGNATLAGTLTQGSSRTLKHVQALSAVDVLAKLTALDIHQWQYLHTPNDTHIGPMAEDFYQVYSLGRDDQHIAASDLAGVALASTKALANKLASQTAAMAALERENAELKRRLERLERIITPGSR